MSPIGPSGPLVESDVVIVTKITKCAFSVIFLLIDKSYLLRICNI